jgi:hypothetical protein
MAFASRTNKSGGWCPFLGGRGVSALLARGKNHLADFKADSNPGPPAREEREGLPRFTRGWLFSIGWLGSGHLLPLRTDGRKTNFQHDV